MSDKFEKLWQEGADLKLSGQERGDLSNSVSNFIHAHPVQISASTQATAVAKVLAAVVLLALVTGVFFALSQKSAEPAAPKEESPIVEVKKPEQVDPEMIESKKEPNKSERNSESEAPIVPATTTDDGVASSSTTTNQLPQGSTTSNSLGGKSKFDTEQI